MQCAGCGVELVGYATCPGCGAPVSDADELPDRWPLPVDPWTLTAPESYALRYGPLWGGTRVGAFKLALTELLARRALTLDGAYVRRRLTGRRRGVWLLSDGPQLTAIREPSLTPIVDAYRNAHHRHAVMQTDEPVQGILITDLIRSVTNRRGGLRGYVRRDLAGALKQRGLVDQDGKLTADGERADRELDRWIELGRGPFAHRTRDLGWSCAYLAGAGAAVLLVSDAYPALAHLAAAVHAGPTADQAFAASAGPQDLGADGALDLSATDLPGLVHGALSGLDDAFAIVDATFVSLAGDVGGRGDGGDGGG